jgi:two-component system, OmpR family, sensor histidine kinase KdpD
MSSPGKLKIFLGYAAGVGKTYQMLDEAQSLKAKGVDVVIGYFEPHGRKDTIAKTEGLETVPRKKVDYRGATFEEMDTEAIIARHPQVAVVDEFPHTNVPGSAREKRWEDVLFLLEHGIDVLTTMNVQHLESLNDHMAHVTGVKVRETIPDWVVKQAVEVVMVDLTPRALLNRLGARRGVSAGQSQTGDGEFLQGINAGGAARDGFAPDRHGSGRAAGGRAMPPLLRRLLPRNGQKRQAARNCTTRL